ncbi:unnamed protein product [Discosporangium mesarthrocarpum]
MGDEGDPLEERVDAAYAILSGAAEEDLGDLKSELQVQWESHLRKEEAAEVAVKAAKLEEFERSKEEERRQVAEAEELRRKKAAEKTQRSAEEQKERERLLDEYGYSEDPVDEEGNPIDQDDAEGAAGAQGGDDDLDVPGNRERVMEAMQAKREAQKKAHHDKVVQDKLALERDKMRKDMAKNARKTQKGERRR